MKRIINLLLIALAVVSCKGVKTREVNAITFDSIVVQEKIKLLPDKPDSIPYATLDIKFVYPAAFGTKEQLQKLQSVFYENVLGEQYAKALAPDSVVKTYVKDYVNMYRENSADFNQILLEYEKDEIPYYAFSHTRSISNRIEYKNEALLSFSVHADEYLGGVHGTYIQENVVVNLNTLEKIQEADVFIPDYKEPLARVIREKLLKVMEENAGSDDADLREYFFEFDSIYPNNNFMMDDKGVHYVYNVYEIASYAAGMFEVFILYSEIANLLNAEMLEELLPGIVDLSGEANKPEAKRVNYNDYPIAYVKNSKIHFFNPENETTAELTEETDSVFNCVYSDKDAMFYYTVSRDGKLSIKQMDLSDTSAQPKLLFDLNKPTAEFFSETYGEKAKLKFIKDNLLLECDFVWDYYNFTKFYNYSIKNNTLTIINWDQFESRYGYHPYSPEDESSLKNYKSVYNKAKQLDLSKYMHEDYGDFETEYFFQGASADGSKIVFSIMLGFGDLAHGPYCVADADGTNMQILENTDMGSSNEPLWCNNNVLYICSYESETEKYDWGGAKQIIEFCYTRADDNSIVCIDKDVDCYAVRKKHPIK